MTVAAQLVDHVSIGIERVPRLFSAFRGAPNLLVVDLRTPRLLPGTIDITTLRRPRGLVRSVARGSLDAARHQMTRTGR